MSSLDNASGKPRVEIIVAGSFNNIHGRKKLYQADVALFGSWR